MDFVLAFSCMIFNEFRMLSHDSLVSSPFMMCIIVAPLFSVLISEQDEIMSFLSTMCFEIFHYVAFLVHLDLLGDG